MSDKRVSVIIASVLGSTLEWYDILIFSVGALYISNAFFPSINPYSALLGTLVVFALGFLSRPIGGAVFGHFGDRIGRKPMLVVTMALTGVSTGLIGVLPTYATVGVWAPVSLSLLRLVAGFGLGGEWIGSVLMTAENFERSRGFWVSLVQASGAYGLLLGSVVITILTRLVPQEGMLAYGWRIAFLFSFVLLVIGLYVRFRISETPSFLAAKKANELARSPYASLAKERKSILLLTTLISGSSFSFYYYAVTFTPTLFELLKIITIQTGLTGLTIFSILHILGNISGGIFSDKTGRKIPIIISLITMAVFAYLELAFQGELLFLFFCGVLGFCQGVGYGPIAALLAEAYPTNVRFSGAAISANSGAAFISGPASYITLWLEGFGIFFSPIYVLLVGISGLISLGLMKENNSRDLRGLMSNTVGKNVPRISNPTNLEISDTPVEHD